jgi:hypothetical protein
MRFLRLLIAALVSAMVLLGTLTISVSHAASGQASFSLTPLTSTSATRSYFVITTSKGSSVVGSVRVTNTGTVLGIVKLYGVDATTEQTSGLVYLNQTDPRSDVGAWISLSTPQITLVPKQSQVVSFQLNIPATARSGEHVGGIVAQNAQSQNGAQGGSIQVSVGARTVVAVQVELGSPLTDLLSATGISSGILNTYQVVFVGLNNGGTTLLKPHGTLQVRDSTNQLRMNVSLQLNTFLPQTAIQYPVYVQNPRLGIGTYTASLTLYYGVNGVLTYTTTFQVSS